MGENKALDIFGIQPIANAVDTTVTKSFEGVEGFLKLVCAPALEEVGLLIRDQVRSWRLNNIFSILNKAQGKMEFFDDKLQIKAHPRVALSIIENGSLNDNPEIQELWAGLFASSCTKDGQDDENLIFVDLLKQLTIVEAKILNYACENSKKVIYDNGLMLGADFEIECDELINLTGINDIHRLDRELDHLRSLELIGSSFGYGGFSPSDDKLTAGITPTALALNLYVKTQGYNGDPTKYWNTGLMNQREYFKERKEKEQELRPLSYVPATDRADLQSIPIIKSKKPKL
jgi:hypothetical protein